MGVLCGRVSPGDHRPLLYFFFQAYLLLPSDRHLYFQAKVDQPLLCEDTRASYPSRSRECRRSPLLGQDPLHLGETTHTLPMGTPKSLGPHTPGAGTSHPTSLQKPAPPVGPGFIL